MLAAIATAIDPDDPLDGLVVGDHPDPVAPDGWTTVEVRAASLNHHDLWTLRGVGISEDRLPIVLGCDAAGMDEEGNEVVVHAVISSPDWRGDETLDPKRSLLSERHDGTLAERVCVPRRNLVPKPPSLGFEEATCLPTAWLTAYRMLFTSSGVAPGSTVLVQGAGGGVATALLQIGSAAGYRMWATPRSEAKRERPSRSAPSGLRHRRAASRAGRRGDGDGGGPPGTTPCRPADRGDDRRLGGDERPQPPGRPHRVFFLQLRVVGSTMGTRDELERLCRLCETTGIRPIVDEVDPAARRPPGPGPPADGDVYGNLVLVP